MGKAEIIADLGAGHYVINRVYAGRDALQSKIDAINNRIVKLQNRYSSMPSNTEAEILEKHIVKLQISSLQVQERYFQNGFPEDIEINAYCADYTEGLSGEVGTIDIPGEVSALVNIRPGYDETAGFDAERDGEFWPSIAVGPWTCFLNKCILPGWQKWYPLHRLAWIVSINTKNDTCSVVIQPTLSSQQLLSVNQGDDFEAGEASVYQPSVALYPGFVDFCERNPGNPICSNTEVGLPVELSDDQYRKIREINNYVNTAFKYESDASGYGIGEYFDIMHDPQTDTGDCEDKALTKMDRIINAGIIPAKNIQLLFCNVIGLKNGGHAVAGIQTTNRGFIILDNRYDYLMRKYALDGVYSWDAFQIAGPDVVPVQVLIENVPIEYMHCGAAAFADDDSVVVEFTGQDWDQPKVIGFEYQPRTCMRAHFFPEYNSRDTDAGRNNFVYSDSNGAWTIEGAMTTTVPQHAAAAGVDGIGLYVGGQQIHDAREYAEYHIINEIFVGWGPPDIVDLAYWGKAWYRRFEKWVDGEYIITGMDDYVICFEYQRWGPWPSFEYMRDDIDVLLQYDTASQAWSLATPSGMTAQSQEFKKIASGKALLHGGAFHDIWRKEVRHGGGAVEWFNGWWKQYSSIQENRPDPSAANEIGQAIYGGVKLYSVSSNSWVSEASGSNRYDHASFVVDGMFYIAGGMYSSGLGNGVRDAQAYSYETNAWQSVKSLPYSARQIQGFGIGGRGFVGGGGQWDDATERRGYRYSGEGFWYNKLSDIWETAAGASLPTIFGEEGADSELGGKAKGMRIASDIYYGGKVANHGNILNPITGDWAGTLAPSSRKFGKGEPGAEC